MVRYVKNVGNVFRGFSETVLFEKILEIYLWFGNSCIYVIFCSQYLARVHPSDNITTLHMTLTLYFCSIVQFLHTP